MVAGKVEVLHLTLQISACRVLVQNSPIALGEKNWYDVLCCSHGQLHCVARKGFGVFWHFRYWFWRYSWVSHRE